MKKIIVLVFLIVFSNSLIGQTKKEKKQLKKEKANKEYVAIKKLINSEEYVFNGTWLTAQNGMRIDLSSSSNQMEIKKDSANASMQFFGEVRSIGFKDEGGIVFDNIIKDYKLAYNDKKQRIQISFNVRNKTENFDISILVHKSGFAYVDIFSSHRSTINYEGNLSSIKKE